VSAAVAAAVAAARQKVCRQDEEPGRWVEVAILAVRYGLRMNSLNARLSVVVMSHVSIVGKAYVTRRTSSNVVSPRLAFMMPA
jgi:hypothetical protein